MEENLKKFQKLKFCKIEIMEDNFKKKLVFQKYFLTQKKPGGYLSLSFGLFSCLQAAIWRVCFWRIGARSSRFSDQLQLPALEPWGRIAVLFGKLVEHCLI